MEESYIDEITAMFQSTYHVVNVEEVDNPVLLNKDKLISGELTMDYTTLSFSGASQEAMPYYKHL
jgi:hypothetical protein